jgi:hypothetical protein
MDNVDRLFAKKDKRITELVTQLEQAQRDAAGNASAVIANGMLLDVNANLRAKLLMIGAIASYANIQADNAQIRLLNADKILYDDIYWQPVLDRIRFELKEVIDGTGWTSVKDKLPEDKQDVDVKGIASGQTEPIILESVQYFETCGFISNITHWRPHAA